MSYNHLSSSRRFLKRHRKGPPSMTIHVHPGFVKIENTNGVFLADGPVKQLVDAVYSERLGADMIEALEQAGVQYYDGMLIVDVHEYRGAGSHADDSLLDSVAPTPTTKPSAASLAATAATRLGRTYAPSSHTLAASTGISSGGAGGAHGHGQPNIYRVALSRTSQSLWTELGMLFAEAGMTQKEAVALEARILLATSPALCLEPSFEVTKIANYMLNKTMTQERPQPPKRKASELEKDAVVSREDQLENQRERDRLLFGDPAANASFLPNFGRYNYILQWRNDRNNLKTHPAPVEPHTSTSLPTAGLQTGGSLAQPTLTNLARPALGLSTSGSVAGLPKIAKAKPTPKLPASTPAAASLAASKGPPAKRKKAAAMAAAAAAGRQSNISVTVPEIPSNSGSPWQ